MNIQPRDTLLTRGVDEIIVETEVLDLLNSGKPLRLKMGFDPSAPDIHIGHVVGLRKLRQMQELGHKVVLIVGDWTAQIGDPSGRSQTRPILTKGEVHKNAESYLSQFFKIVQKNKTELRWQSEWFSDFDLSDVIRLTSRFTVAQFLAREDFAKRFKANHPITITELLYPLLQAFDSIAVGSDIEFGGTDQKFNLLVGRALQQMMGHKPQNCFIVPILPGTDGVQKMSKSLGNYIGVSEAPSDIFGKTMSLPDDMILTCFKNLTDVPDSELSSISSELKDRQVNPMELKKKLARELVTQFCGLQAADLAQDYFERTVQKREMPTDIGTYLLSSPSELKNVRLSRIMVDSKLASSSSEARRLINQGAVRINNIKVADDCVSELSDGDVMSIGRRRWIRFSLSDQ